jgi:hypothetical protein
MFSNLTDLAAFLKFGPLGLAGLLLVLMATALTFKLSEARERLILRILYVGAFCYVVASVSAYASLHYDSDANKTADLYRARDASQMRAFGSITAFTEHSIGDLTKLNALTGDGFACPGGGRGQPIPHGADMTALGTSIMSDLSKTKQAIASVAHGSP